MFFVSCMAVETFRAWVSQCTDLFTFHVKEARQLLGRKDIRTTLNIYAHAMPSPVKEASDKVADFLYNDLIG